MTSYSAVESWTFGQARMPAPSAHLTRRGRLVRAAAMLAMIGALALVLLGKLTGEPVQAGEGTTDLVIPAHSVTVMEGDSLWGIARVVAPQADPRETVLQIREINGLSSSTIQPGQVLLVPDGR